MRQRVPPLLLLHPDPKFRARVADAARRNFTVQPVGCWNELNTTLRAASPATLAVVDPYTNPGKQAELCPELHRLLRELPSVAVLAALEIRPRRHADLRLLGEWGIVEIISETEDDAAATGRLLHSARSRPLRGVLEEVLPEYLSGRARSILTAAADVSRVWAGRARLWRNVSTSRCGRCFAGVRRRDSRRPGRFSRGCEFCSAPGCWTIRGAASRGWRWPAATPRTADYAVHSRTFSA